MRSNSLVRRACGLLVLAAAIVLGRVPGLAAQEPEGCGASCADLLFGSSSALSASDRQDIAAQLDLPGGCDAVGQ